MSSAASSSSAPRKSTSRRRLSKKQRLGAANFFNEVGARPLGRRCLGTPQIQCELELGPISFFTTNTVTPVYQGYYIVLSNFSQYNEYLSLFDQYRVDWADAWLEPTAAMGTTVFAPLATTVDLDDANVPTAYAQVAAHPHALVGMGASGRHHSWKPHVAVAAYSGAFSSFANQASEWCDSASPGIQHYGFKVAAFPTPVAIPYTLSIRLICSFKNPGL
jgi:hypothetical protein